MLTPLFGQQRSKALKIIYPLEKGSPKGIQVLKVVFVHCYAIPKFDFRIYH